MAAERVGRRGACRDAGLSLQKRQARVTVKYNRTELQRRLDVEKWIDLCVEQLYSGREEMTPQEINIDQLLDLCSDAERADKLQEILHACNNNTEAFIAELLVKLHGLQKQEELQSQGIEHPHTHCVHRQTHTQTESQ